jgi:ribonucleoside-diphosphate reductase alpha chain
MSYQLPTDYQTFIATSRYSRWRDDLGRRENWEETVDRYFDFFSQRLSKDGKLTEEVQKELAECREAVLKLEVLPSMRALMTAGKALERDEVAGFNCSYVAVDHPHAFDEIMYVLTCGTGAGFSVESEDVSKLPDVPAEFHPTDTVIVVADSKIGWATAYRELISMLYAGKIPKWDVSKVRPSGARLKTFGGRASGPAPLVRLFEFTVKVFTGAAGRKLKPIECHDIVCKIAEIVVVGGVRRSALLGLSDLSDSEIRHCKSGNWWENNVQRALANNSAVYNSKPDIGQFMEEWLSLYRSGSGERGIFNRYVAQRYISELPNRDSNYRFGANPCLEILLRSAQFCNLSSVQISPNDTADTLRKKVKIATILGTLQSSLTNFRYLRKIWKRNSEEERLLGVSFSGICDNEMMSNPYSSHLKELLSELREYAREVNKDWSAKIGVNESTAITCVKPEGSTSQLADRASGIHPRYSQYYIRTVRADKKDPLAIMMKDAGFPVEDDVTKPDSTYVFSFPMKSPEGSKMRDDMTAIDQLELWLTYKKYWADHTVSCTIYVREHEWVDVAAWVYKHFDHISGLSFLPHSNHVYKQAPYTECTKEEYEAALSKMPDSIDWDALALYEKSDETTGTQEMACSAGSCDLV